MSYEYAIGFGIPPTNLSDLSVPIKHPRSQYQRYPVRVDLGDNSARGFGNPTTEWRWGFLSMEERDQLKLYCPEASSEVYIRTRRRDTGESWATFRCKMIWPEVEEFKTGRVLDFAVIFRDMVAV